MKKTLRLSLLIGFCLSAFTAFSQIVITEIMYNPPESNIDSLEYIEVLNNGNAPVDMTGWTLGFGSFTFTVPSLTLPAGAYQVFSVNDTAFFNNFGVASIEWDNGALGNNGATIRLTDLGGTVIDEVIYDDAAPWPVEPDAMGPSLVLCDPNADNSLASSWQKAGTEVNGLIINGLQVYGNPGAASGCVGSLTANPDMFTVLPNQPTHIAPLANDNAPNAITFMDITGAPAHGSVLINADNTLTYTSTGAYCGPDQMTYEVCDNTGECASATITVNIKCYAQRTIAQMTSENVSGMADSIGISCQLQGTVYGVNIQNAQGGLQFVIMDATGDNGITVFKGNANYGYTVQEGDGVTVRGTIAQFRGLTQIVPDTLFKTSSNNALVNPTTVLHPDESTENRLIRINNLHVIDSTQVGPAGVSILAISDSNPNDTILVRIDNDVDLYNLGFDDQAPFNVVGLGGQFDTQDPLIHGYQILPRYVNDISPVTAVNEPWFARHVRLSPNPSSDVLRIESLGQRFDRFTVRNATGSAISSVQNPDFLVEWTVNAWPAGVYTVEIEKDGQVYTKRWVKQ